MQLCILLKFVVRIPKSKHTFVTNHLANYSFVYCHREIELQYIKYIYGI